MSDYARKRQACSLLAQLPDEHEDVRAIVGHMQELVDEYLLRDGTRPRPRVVSVMRGQD